MLADVSFHLESVQVGRVLLDDLVAELVAGLCVAQLVLDLSQH